MDSDWSPAQSKSVERRQSVQWKAKAEELQDRVDFLEAALEAKSQSYEEDMTALEERLAGIRELLRTSFRMIPRSECEDVAQLAGWIIESDKGYLLPDGAFGQWDDEQIDQALSAGPAGQVLCVYEGKLRHDTKSRSWWFSPERLDFPTLTWPDELIDFQVKDGMPAKFVVTTCQAKPETEQGGE